MHYCSEWVLVNGLAPVCVEIMSKVPQDSFLDFVFFKFFINDLDDRTEGMLNKSANGRNMGDMASSIVERQHI